jgi:hypothetical protein
MKNTVPNGGFVNPVGDADPQIHNSLNDNADRSRVTLAKWVMVRFDEVASQSNIKFSRRREIINRDATGETFIVAEVNKHDSMILHEDFFTQTNEQRVITILHEAMHLQYGFTDQALAAAASRYGGNRGQSFTDRNAASKYFDEKLAQECRP